MIVHYSITAELARQRQEQLARSYESCRRPLRPSRPRWWEPGFLRHPAAGRGTPSPARDGVPATA